MSMRKAIVGFLLFCDDKNALKELGLRLDEEAEFDLIDLGNLPGKSRLGSRHKSADLRIIWFPIHGTLLTAMRKQEATARNSIIQLW
jgi:hypothetical protein